MVPRFWMLAVEVPENLSEPPERKALSGTLSVEATKAAVSIRAPWPTTIPFGLISRTWPFEVSAPCSSEGSLPVTRLSVAALTEGCTKLIVSPGFSETPVQLMMVRCVLVVICVVAPVVEIVALPAATVPPVGPASASGEAQTRAAAPTSAVVDRRPPRRIVRSRGRRGCRLRLKRSSNRKSRRR